MLKVVIADDEARILSLIRLLPDWDALGMEVAGTAGNGLEALALIERERPDILITDIRMPGCQGLELIERARRAVPDIEIIIISGYAHFEYAQTAINGVCRRGRAGVAQWQSSSFPSWPRGFDSHHPLHTNSSISSDRQGRNHQWQRQSLSARSRT